MRRSHSHLGPCEVSRGAEYDPRHHQAADWPNGAVLLDKCRQRSGSARPVVSYNEELRAEAQL